MNDYLGPYLLGPNDENQGIYTGDARELAQAIPDESVDLVLTDPPFGIGFNYGSGYEDSPDDYLDLVRWIIIESNRVIRPGGLCFVFVAQPQLRHVWPLFPDNSRVFAACKNFVQMRPTLPVQYAFDPVIFWYGDEVNGKGMNGRDWHVGNTANTNNRGLHEAGFHACPRPLDTIWYMVEHFCPCTGAVVDFFMGSGTTAVAAKLCGVRWWGSEIVADTAELARKRVRETQPPLFVPQPEQMELEMAC